MIILVVEDLGSVSLYLVSTLRDLGHEVLEAGDIDDARSFWDDRHGDIDCLVVDANMDPAGLEDGHIDETRGGLLTGWVWLKHNVFPECPEMKSRTIIYTDYLSHLEANVEEEELRELCRVAKSGHPTDGMSSNRGVGADQVLEYVKRIARLPSRRKRNEPDVRT